MANDRFEEVIRIVLQSEGQETADKLRRALDDLGDAGAAADPKVAALLDEIEKIGRASAAVTTLESLAGKQDDLAEAADRTGLRLKLATQAQEAANATLEEAKKAVDDAREAQSEYAASEDRTTEGTKARAAAVKAAIAVQKQANAEYRDADAALKDASDAYDRVATSQSRLKTQTGGLLDELRAAGVSTTDLAEAQAALSSQAATVSARIKAAADAAGQLAQEQRELAGETARGAAERDQYNAALNRTSAASAKAKTETKGLGDEANVATGVFDRMKGVLAGLLGVFSFASLVNGIKSIIGAGSDAEQALGQLNAALASTNNAAGLTGDELLKMAAKARESSRLSTEQIVAAQTRLLSYTSILRGEFPAALQVTIDQAERLGISVEQSAEIVGKALQSPSDAMAALGRQGFKLEEGQKTLLKQLEATGRTAEAQKIIIDLLSESYGGAAAAARVGTMAGLWKGFTDQIGDFISLISDSGVFEYLKAQLVTLTATIQRMTADGSLKEWATAISNALIRVAEAIKSGAKFVTDHATAITLLAKAYALVKFESFLAGLASIAAGTTKAGSAVQLLSLAITKIPAVRIAILGAAGITLLSDEIGQLTTKIYENTSVGQKWKARMEELQAETRANAERFGEAAKALSEFSSVQIKSAAETARLSKEERAAYAESRSGLEQYLRMQVKYYEQLKAGNALTAEGVEYLNDLRDKLAATRAALDSLTEGTRIANNAISNDLTAGAQILVETLAKVITSGQSAAEQLGKLFENMDVKSTEQLGDMALAIQFIADTSDAAGRRLRDGLGAELKKLTGEELLRFQQSATIAFEETGRAGEQAAFVLQATLQTALDRLGVSAAESGAKITASGRDIIATFTAVSENAQASGIQIEAAFRKAVGSAETKAEVEALGAGLEAAASRGTIGAQQTERAMISLRARIRELAVEADPLSDQFEQLGIKSQRALDGARDSAREAFEAIAEGAAAGSKNQGDLVRAFEAMAAAERAAVAQSTEAERDRVERALAQKAAVLGLTGVLEELGNKGKEAGEKISLGLGAAKQSADELAASTKLAELGYAELLYEANTGNAAAKKMLEAIRSGADTTSYAATGVQTFTAAIVGATTQFYVASDAMDEFNATTNKLDFYTRNLGRTVFTSSEELANYERRLSDATEATDRLASITRQLQDERDRAMGNEAQVEQRRYADQVAEITTLIEQQSAAQQAGNTSFNRSVSDGQDALRLAREAHKERMAQLKEEQQQRTATAAAATAQQSASTPPSRPSSPASTSNAPGVVNQTNNFEIHGVFAGSVNELARLLKPELDKIARLSQ